MKTSNVRVGANTVFLCSLLLLTACDLFVPVEQKIARAEKRLEAGDQRGALIELQNVVRSEPGNVRAQLLIAEISLQVGDARAARKELDQAIAAGAGPEQTSELLARIMLAQGLSSDLLAELQSGKIQLSAPERALYRGLALQMAEQNDAAAAALKEALRLDPAMARAHIALAEMSAASGDSEGSLAEIAAALEADASNAEALLLRGTLLGRRGEFRESITALEAARQNANRLSVRQYSAVLAALAEAQLASGDKAGARDTQKELAARLPDAAITQSLAARLAMADQDYAAATAAARKALAAAPNFTPVRMLLGAALLADGSLNQAEAELAAVVQAAPESIEARKLLAQVNLRMQRPDVAMQVLAPVLQADSGDPQLNALMGWANLQRGDAGSGIALLEKGVAGEPTNEALKMDLATAYVSAGRSDDAVKLLESIPVKAGGSRRTSLLVNAISSTRGKAAAATELDRLRSTEPDNVSLLNLGAAFHAQQRDFLRAREWIDRAAAVAPNDVPTLINRARIEVVAGDAAAAKRVLQRAAELAPSDPAPRLAMVELALREGDSEGAAVILEELRARDPKAVESRLQLVRLYVHQKNAANKADVIVREIQSQGAAADVSHALGRIYLDAGRFDEALNFFRDAVRLDPGNPAYGMAVARAQLALGNTGSARETLQRNVQASPGSFPAAATLVLLDLREGRRDAALARLGALKQAHPRDANMAVLEGEVASYLKDYHAAAVAYESAYRMSPSGATALRAYRAHDLAGDVEPQALLEDWVSKHPGDESVRMVLADAYIKRGLQARAIAQYESIAESVRPNAMALNNLAWLYQQARDPRAANIAKRAYAAAPTIAAVADTYGWILVEDGRVDDALPILQRAAASKDAVPDISYHYAVALTKAGRDIEARQVLEDVVAKVGTSPTGAAAQRLLSELGQ